MGGGTIQFVLYKELIFDRVRSCLEQYCTHLLFCLPPVLPPVDHPFWFFLMMFAFLTTLVAHHKP